MEGWADRRVSIVGGGDRRPCPPPPRNGKKHVSEEILTSFTYVLLMKLGGIDKHCIHAKWKTDRRLSMVGGGGGEGAPIGNEKKGSQRKF